MRANEEGPILLFDGVCNFCDATVQFIILRDPQKIFRFSPLQSEAGQKLLKQFQLPLDRYDTMVLFLGEKFYTQSSAALQIMKRLAFPWPLFYYGLVLVPKGIRDMGYRVIAKNRYKWFGKKDSCPLPPPEIRSRFLE